MGVRLHVCLYLSIHAWVPIFTKCVSERNWVPIFIYRVPIFYGYLLSPLWGQGEQWCLMLLSTRCAVVKFLPQKTTEPIAIYFKQTSTPNDWWYYGECYAYFFRSPPFLPAVVDVEFLSLFTIHQWIFTNVDVGDFDTMILLIRSRWNHQERPLGYVLRCGAGSRATQDR